MEILFNRLWLPGMKPRIAKLKVTTRDAQNMVQLDLAKEESMSCTTMAPVSRGLGSIMGPVT